MAKAKETKLKLSEDNAAQMFMEFLAVHMHRTNTLMLDFTEADFETFYAHAEPRNLKLLVRVNESGLSLLLASEEEVEAMKEASGAELQ